MKEYLIFSIFLFLIKRKKTTTKEVADVFGISLRSAYRYINVLSSLGVPIITKMGRGGGISIIGNIYLENLGLKTTEKEKLEQFLIDEKLTEEIKNIIQKII